MKNSEVPRSFTPEQIGNLPLGEGGRLEELKEVKQAFEVKNTMSWVNPEMELPFKLEEGQPTKLGVFIGEKTGDEVSQSLEIAKAHGRSGLLGRVIFGDEQGRHYRDVDLKGVGLTSKEAASIYFSQKYHGAGLFAKEDALFDRDMSENSKLGVRTHRVAAIIDLQEIIAESGERISVEEARKQGILKDKDEVEFDPVVEVRAMGTRYRVKDAAGGKENKKGWTLIEDGKKIVAAELGIKPEEFSTTDYLKWFAKNLGEQVKIIHDNHFTHNYLTDHNITLDGRIVDLDSVEERKQGLSRNDVINEITTAKQTLYILRQNIDQYDQRRQETNQAIRQGKLDQLISDQALKDIFDESYGLSDPEIIELTNFRSKP